MLVQLRLNPNKYIFGGFNKTHFQRHYVNTILQFASISKHRARQVRRHPEQSDPTVSLTESEINNGTLKLQR